MSKECLLCGEPGDDLVFNFYCSNKVCKNYKDGENKIVEENKEQDNTKNNINYEERTKRIIRQEILVNQSYLVEDLLERGIIEHEEIQNYWPDPYNFTVEEIKQACIDYGVPLMEGEDIHDTCDELVDFMEPADVFEWWVVTDWLAMKLDKIGEPILCSDYGTWWGRTCTGQSIELDGTIQRIVRDL